MRLIEHSFFVFVAKINAKSEIMFYCAYLVCPWGTMLTSNSSQSVSPLLTKILYKRGYGNIQHYAGCFDNIRVRNAWVSH